jgi:hypothetical protein
MVLRAHTLSFYGVPFVYTQMGFKGIFRFAPTISHYRYMRKYLHMGGAMSKVIAGGVEF